MKFQNFRVLTFDVGGTLIDFETGLLTHIRRAGGDRTKSLTDDEIFEPYLEARRLYLGRSSEFSRHVYLHLAKTFGLSTSSEAADSFQWATLHYPAFPDSIEAMARLRRHFRLVAMTIADGPTLAFYSRTLGKPFHDEISLDQAQYAKPDPRYFSYTLGRLSTLGYRQDEILHVAQSQYHDIGVAKELGYKTCWIERRAGLKGYGGTPVPEKVTQPDFHYSTLAEFADEVDAERLNAR